MLYKSVSDILEPTIYNIKNKDEIIEFIIKRLKDDQFTERELLDYSDPDELKDRIFDYIIEENNLQYFVDMGWVELKPQFQKPLGEELTPLSEDELFKAIEDIIEPTLYEVLNKEKIVEFIAKKFREDRNTKRGMETIRVGGQEFAGYDELRNKIFDYIIDDNNLQYFISKGWVTLEPQYK